MQAVGRPHSVPRRSFIEAVIRPGNLQKLFSKRAACSPYNKREAVRILVVEDEQKLAKALRDGLEADHHAVTVANTGEDGFYLASAERFDLLILDVMLPGRDGFEILTTLRQRGAVMPVLLLTARDSVEDRVRGLDSGADDYLIKPFASGIARPDTCSGSPRATEAVTRLKLADLEMDVVRRAVTRSGEALDLTPANSTCWNIY